MSTIVDTRMKIDYDLARRVMLYCNRVTESETATESSYSWVSRESGNICAYGIFTKAGSLLEVYGGRSLQNKTFEGADADELKKVGHYERPIEIIPLPADNKVTVLWNAGWDDYRINPARVRDMTADELGKDHCFPTVGNGDWLKCSFIRQYGLGTDNQVVYIIDHLGGGD